MSSAFFPRRNYKINLSNNNTVAKIKLVIIGNSAAGKTCIAQRIINNIFNVNNSSTINVEPKNKRQELEDSLRYLKSKINKTVQDKNSIGVIEAVLKNM